MTTLKINLIYDWLGDKLVSLMLRKISKIEYNPDKPEFNK